MLQSCRIVLLYFCIVANALLAENSQSTIQNDSTIEPLYPPAVLEGIQAFIDKERQQQNNSSFKQSDFSELDLKKMNLVFKSSPKEAQLIVQHLQDPTYFPLNEDYRSAIFVGEPGSGKTTMAKAIANKMTEHGWEYKILSSTSLLGEQRNHTARLLKNEFDEIEASKKPIILIIDELNLLMEHTESKHHDTDATAKALWMFLDKQSSNKNFFFIGTMNRINKLPKPYKNRILSDYITFPLMTDSTIKIQFLRDYLTSSHTELDKEITDDFLKKEVDKIGDSSGRDLENISRIICRTSKMNESISSSPLLIKQAAISYATDEYLRKKMESDYDIEEETDEERQERHHKETLEMNERHFVQQQMISINTSFYLTTTSTAYKNKVLDLISDEQKEIFDAMLAKTNERKSAEEAAIKKAAEENSILNHLFRKKQ